MGITWKQINERRKRGERHLLRVETDDSKEGCLILDSHPLDMSNLLVKTTKLETRFPKKNLAWEQPWEDSLEVDYDSINGKLREGIPLEVTIIKGEFRSYRGKLPYNLEWLFLYEETQSVMIDIDIYYRKKNTQLSWVHKKIR